MNAELYLIQESFPDLKELILSRFECDEEFQALCLDYFSCLKSLHVWETNLKMSKECHKRYVVLKKGLEEKLLQHINSDNGSFITPLNNELPNKNS